MYKLWSKVYEANYHKSLDHRSFYFKQVHAVPVALLRAPSYPQDMMRQHFCAPSLTAQTHAAASPLELQSRSKITPSWIESGVAWHGLWHVLTPAVVRQTDKKSLGAKAMVAEIKEAAEKQKSGVEEKSILAVSASAPFASRLVPHLTFAYRDPCAPHCWVRVYFRSA